MFLFSAALVATLLSPNYSKAVPLVPGIKDYPSRHQDVIALLKENDFPKAIKGLKEAIKKDPEDLSAYHLLAIAYLGAGDEKNAAEQAMKVKKTDPEYASDIYGSMGRYYIAKRRFYKALFYFQESLKIKEDPEVLKLTASIYLNQGSLKNARSYYEKLLAKSPDYTSLSRIYLAEADFEKAILYSQKAIREDAKASGAYLVLGTGYLLTDRIDSAKVNFNILREINPEFFLTSYFLGLAYLAEGNYENALSEFQNLSRSSPKLKEAYLNTAVIHHITGDLVKAKEAAAKAIEADPLDPVCRLVSANIHLSSGRTEEADAEFQRAVDFMPDMNGGFKSSKYFSGSVITPAYFSLSAVYLKAGLYQQALKAINATVILEPMENPFYILLKAASEKKLGRLKEAEELYTVITKKSPEIAAAHMELGELALKEGNTQKALGFYNKASKAQPHSVRINLRLADIYSERLKDRDKAIEEYRKAIAASPDMVYVYSQLARMLAEKGDLSEALKYARKGYSINPEDSDIKDTLGWVHLKLGNVKEALDAYSEVIKYGTRNPTAYYHLGLVYQKMNEKNKAAEAFEKALDLTDEFPEAGETKKILTSISEVG